MDYRAIYSTYTVNIPTGATYQVWRCDISGTPVDLVYSGKALATGATTDVNISDIARAFLDSNMGPHCFSTSRYAVNNNGYVVVMLEYSTDNGDTWITTTPVCFVNNWSYDNAEGYFNNVMSDPVNGHATRGMYYPYTKFAATDTTICADAGYYSGPEIIRYKSYYGNTLEITNLHGYIHQGYSEYWPGFDVELIDNFYEDGYGHWLFDGPVKTIAPHAFHECSGLTWIEIPSECTEVGRFAFEDCNRLTGIYALPTNAPYNYSDSFSGIGRNGVLYYPRGSDYSNWMLYLNGYNWTKQQIW